MVVVGLGRMLRLCRRGVMGEVDLVVVVSRCVVRSCEILVGHLVRFYEG
jgi:hypothetical protein